jgi:hypothetical protein
VRREIEGMGLAGGGGVLGGKGDSSWVCDWRVRLDIRCQMRVRGSLSTLCSLDADFGSSCC